MANSTRNERTFCRNNFLMLSRGEWFLSCYFACQTISVLYYFNQKVHREYKMGGENGISTAFN
ncbi:hypothetical protein ACFSOV_18170 [Pedobacter petrophilus]|uniref:hypothetical protein n=1 Tax=Pedobacter petrophilus TaxID=1908241 RepID=UPI00363A80FA